MLHNNNFSKIHDEFQILQQNEWNSYGLASRFFFLKFFLCLILHPTQLSSVHIKSIFFTLSTFTLQFQKLTSSDWYNPET